MPVLFLGDHRDGLCRTFGIQCLTGSQSGHDLVRFRCIDTVDRAACASKSLAKLSQFSSYRSAALLRPPPVVSTDSIIVGIRVSDDKVLVLENEGRARGLVVDAETAVDADLVQALGLKVLADDMFAVGCSGLLQLLTGDVPAA